MEELEKFINRCKECKFAACEQCEISYREVKAIENLIARNKQLDYKNAHEYRRACKERDKYWKSKIKEKIEELNFKLAEDANGKIDATYNIRFTIQVLQELLLEYRY